MTALAIQPISFSFHESHDVRIQVIDSDPWFCLKDVCEILSVSVASPSRFQMGMKGITKLVTPTDGGSQLLTFVNEPNLYRVIFRSNKPEAKQFQDWVFNEVLPTIRKTGNYSAPNPRQNAEPLNANDMVNLKWLINMMTVRFKYQEAWNQGIWYSLRRATGTPSPHPFSVDDLPALSQECRRIIEVTNDASALICQFEKDVLKHVIRNRKDFDAIASKLQSDFQLLQIPMEGMQTLEKFEEVGLMRLVRRAH